MQILRASAGSGKTYALAYEYIKNVIRTPEKYSSILAVTFTNKATDEMKRRILKELDELRTPTKPQRHSYLDRLIKELDITEDVVAKNASSALGMILHDYSRFSVLTIDRFFQKILRSFVKELGLESDYAVDFNLDYIIDRAIDGVVDKSREDENIAKNINDFTNELIENSKSYNIKGALSKYAMNIFSEEFSPDNKEPYILFRDAVLAMQKEVVDAMKTKADEALALIHNSGLTVEDCPSRKTGFYAYLVRISNGDVLLYDKGNIKGYNSYVAKAKDGNWGKKPSRGLEAIKPQLLPLLQDVCDEWDENKSFLCSVDLFLKNYHKFLLLNDIAQEVDEVCSAANIMLLSTTMQLLTSLTSENDAPFIYEKCGNSYDVFMIDEFQDTSVRQWANFAPLINNALAQCEEAMNCVTIVGDVKQSIYRWRGGDWKLLDGDLKNDIELQENIQEKTLDTNWRSYRTVVGFNNALVGAVADLLNKNLNRELSDIENLTLEQKNEFADIMKRAYTKAEQKYAPKNSEKKGYVRVSECDFGVDENLMKMVEAIKGLQSRGCAARDIAIITRTNKQAKKVVESLLAQKDAEGNEAYCFDAISNQALYLTNSKAVRLIISIFKLGTVNYENNSVLVAEYNKFLGRELNAPLLAEEEDLISQIRELSVVEAFEKVLDCYNPAKSQNDVAYIQALYEQIIGFSMQNVTDVSMFLDWWEKEKSKLSITLPDGQNAINVITIHSAKGLEYDAVIIPYFDWKLAPKSGEQIWVDNNSEPFDIINNTLIPYKNALSESYFAYSYSKEKIMSYVDNINVLYVAITRAAKELYLMLPEKEDANSVASSFKEVAKVSNGVVVIKADCERADSLDIEIEGRLETCGDSVENQRNEYVFGEKVNFEVRETVEKDAILVKELMSVDYHKNERIQLRYSTERYYEDDKGEKHLTPRSYGILMHKLFERIECYTDIVEELEAMRIDGIMTQKECDEIAGLVTKAFENKDIVQFFDTDWTVKNEQNILLPKYGENIVYLRPDRVIASEGKAKVLDYKFGASKNDKNIAQMRSYMDLLQKMGYKEVEGYVWYVQRNEVDKVTTSELMF